MHMRIDLLIEWQQLQIHCTCADTERIKKGVAVNSISIDRLGHRWYIEMVK